MAASAFGGSAHVPRGGPEGEMADMGDVVLFAIVASVSGALKGA